jgi:hypothetical protein
VALGPRLRGDDEGGKVAEIKTIAACAAVPKSEGEKCESGRVFTGVTI